jgi:predicted outer membrane protein
VSTSKSSSLTASIVGLVLAGSLATPKEAQAEDAQRVLRNMQHLNQVVIKAASLAQRRAGREDVRSFARRTEMDHRFVLHRVLELADELQLELAKPDATEQAKRLDQFAERLGELEALRGPDFDLLFLRLMRAANLHAIDLLSSAETHVDPGLARALDRLIPIYEQHVELALHLTGTSEAQAKAGD